MLQKFIDAQQQIFETALQELEAGRKTTHWMWFVFPQIKGLGSSPMAQRYAINSLQEAQAYLAHPLLGQRLKACAKALLKHADKDIKDILPYPDDLKLKSSMTLFNLANPQEKIFEDVLHTLFNGEKDKETLRIVNEY